jgi:N-acetylglucosamine-6-phosphate deacetylase
VARRRIGVAAAVVEGTLVAGDVSVEDGLVTDVGLPAGASGLAIAGMVDCQVNGYAGVDFLTGDAEGWVRAARAMAGAGVTAYVANLITAPEPMTCAALATAEEVRSSTPADAAELVGAHLEGPFLSADRAGTHPLEHLRAPDPEVARRLLDAGPVIGMTIAPELPGAIELVARLHDEGLLVALGHSDATADQAHAGFDAGAAAVTHVFNGMSAPRARAPGLAGVALVRGDVAVQMICDGVHLDADVVRLVIAAAGDRFVLVTDALSAADAGAGTHRLGSMTLSVVDGWARRDDGTLAGSLLSMAAAVRNAVEAGASLIQAVAAATSRPAALLGRPDLGVLRPGARADVAVLDDGLDVTQVYRAGVPLR